MRHRTRSPDPGPLSAIRDDRLPQHPPASPPKPAMEAGAVLLSALAALCGLLLVAAITLAASPRLPLAPTTQTHARSSSAQQQPHHSPPAAPAHRPPPRSTAPTCPAAPRIRQKNNTGRPDAPKRTHTPQQQHGKPAHGASSRAARPHAHASPTTHEPPSPRPSPPSTPPTPPATTEPSSPTTPTPPPTGNGEPDQTPPPPPQQPPPSADTTSTSAGSTTPPTRIVPPQQTQSTPGQPQPEPQPTPAHDS
jgi:hypothetical protein